MDSQFIDLSKMTPEAVKSSVLKTTVTSPVTVFPMLGSVLFTAFWAIFDAGLMFAGLGAVSLVGGAGMFAYNYFGRYHVFSNKYFLGLRADNEKKARQKLVDVERFLGKHNFNQGAQQVTKLQTIMSNFEEVLARKFEPHELARARYHGVAEQVLLNALGNLEQIVTVLVAIDGIDPDYIQNRLSDLKHQGDLNESQLEEKKALETRWELREQQHLNVDELLSQNERAMTELGKIATNIATSNVVGNSTEEELELAIKNLNSLNEKH